MYGFIEVEPYWNVNIVRCTKSGKQHLIEVEPYWNVNCTHVKPYFFYIMHWSRTILECKCICMERYCQSCSIEVEPYWNVNKWKNRLKTRRINWSRTILECKSARYLWLPQFWSHWSRTILECKCGNGWMNQRCDGDWSRTILECKFNIDKTLSIHVCIEVEPYWNVNFTYTI